MRIFLIILIISTLTFAQEGKKDSPLVDAAKKSGKYKFQKGTKITNDKLKSLPKKEGLVKDKIEVPEDEEITLGEYKDSKQRTKEDWQKMINEAKQSVNKWEMKTRELQSELNKLTNDYYAWDDVAYREGVIKPNMDKTAKELENAKAELEKAKERILELEEEARKSGALPGWLR